MVGQRSGQSLRTKDHDTIKRWAIERSAMPATVPGTELRTEPGILRFDFPGFGGRDLRHVTWEEFFRTFDSRDLSMIYQETKAGVTQSNFFRFENPRRDDH